MESEQHERASAVLQSIWEDNRARDYDGWLQSEILSTEGLILEQQGRIAEALETYRLRAERDFPEHSEFLIIQLSIARTLDQTGQPRAALLELERGLDAVQESGFQAALTLLAAYAGISRREHEMVPIRYRDLLEKIRQSYAIETPDDALGDSSSLTEAILATEAATLKAFQRYEELQEELRLSASGPAELQHAIERLRAYIATESVGYYKSMALEHLRRIEEEQGHR